MSLLQSQGWILVDTKDSYIVVICRTILHHKNHNTVIEYVYMRCRKTALCDATLRYAYTEGL